MYYFMQIDIVKIKLDHENIRFNKLCDLPHFIITLYKERNIGLT